MTHRCFRRSSLVAAIAGVLIGGSVIADDTANMTVTAEVAASCSLTAVDTIDFGIVDPIIDNLAQGDITWVCTSGFDTDIELDGGGSGDTSAREMTGPAPLPYQLYSDAARTAVFGNGLDAVPVSGVGYSSPGTVTVYGRINQADAAIAQAGSYSDTVVVTILF